MSKRRYLMPLARLLVLSRLPAASACGCDPREVPSPLIGKPAPAFSLAQLHGPAKMLAART